MLSNIDGCQRDKSTFTDAAGTFDVLMLCTPSVGNLSCDLDLEM